MKRILIGFAAVLTLVACESAEITDGKIPTEFLGEAQKLVGKYVGSMGQRQVDLDVKLEGDRLVVTASPDLINSECGSQIGDLTRVNFNRNSGSPEVTGGIFDFNPKQCANRIEGRSFFVDIESNRGGIELSAYVSETIRLVETCHRHCSGHGEDRDCTETCTTHDRGIKIKGAFRKL